MTHNRNYKRLFAALVCLAMTLTLMPTTAFAQEDVQTSSEVVALREENVKHFDMGDGTYQAISYSHPVHEKDSNGNWQDIDFHMTRKQTRGIATYTNEASGTTFAATYTQNAPLVTLTGESTSISMTLAPSGTGSDASKFTTQRITTSTAAARVTNPQSAIRTIEDAENAQFSSTIVYNNVMPNIDLEYIVDPGTVKENIEGEGLAYPEFRIATITNFKDLPEEDTQETITLIHEFGHFLNILDHSDIKETNNSAYDDNCLYGIKNSWYYNPTTNIMEDIELCGGCRNRIVNFINSYKF